MPLVSTKECDRRLRKLRKDLVKARWTNQRMHGPAQAFWQGAICAALRRVYSECERHQEGLLELVSAVSIPRVVWMGDSSY